MASGRKLTTEEFIEKAKLVEDKEYDYSKVNYLGNKTKVCIICPIHGEFWIRPNDFLNGHMCKFCGIEKRRIKKSFTTKEFIDKAKSIFPQYDYSLVNYVNSHIKVIVICPKHGRFEIKPYHLLNGHGCKKCGQIETHNKQRKSNSDFIAEAIKVHGNKYDYTKVKYVNTETKVCVICPEHGEFYITPHAHLSGKQGCHICSESKLEKNMRQFLLDKHISYMSKKHFDWLGKQHLDFYLPDYGVGIECQGIQHFENVNFFGGDVSFKERIERDERKKKLCEENGIPLFYYSEFEHSGVYTNKELLIKDIRNEST